MTRTLLTILLLAGLAAEGMEDRTFRYQPDHPRAIQQGSWKGYVRYPKAPAGADELGGKPANADDNDEEAAVQHVPDAGRESRYMRQLATEGSAALAKAERYFAEFARFNRGTEAGKHSATIEEALIELREQLIIEAANVLERPKPGEG